MSCRKTWLIATNETVINHYFDLLEQTLVDNDLLESPALTYNCDETGLPLDCTPSSVVGIKGQKHPRAVTTGKRKQITALACGNAAGNVIPPLVIFSRKALNPTLTINEVPGTMYGLNQSGWMDSDILFELWFTHHILVHVPSVRPILLLLDGHSTHYNPAFVRKAAEEKVIVFCLLPNTTHLTQPLDKGVFCPLKTYWAEECQMFMAQNPGQVVTQYNFMTLFSRAWYRTMTIPNVIAAFKTTGVHPFNRHASKLVDDMPQLDNISLCEKTGLAYIPLYSSARSRPGTVCAQLCPSSQEPHNFTAEEVACYAKRYEEGYDIASYERYNLWLQQHERANDPKTPSINSLPTASNLLLGDGSHQSSVLKRITQLPKPLPLSTQSYSDKCGKVLTSSENRRIIE